MTAALRLRYSLSANQSQGSYPPFSGGPSDWNPPNSSGGSSADASSSYFARSFNSNVVVVMAVLLFALVVAAFINTMARCILHRGRGSQQQVDGSAGMRDKGLDKREIEALPVVAYGSSVPTHLHLDGTIGSECVVCLSEFIPGEQVRLLPGCHHGFHIACIDAWLLTHASCPVCRHSAIPGGPSCSSNSNENEPNPSDCININNNNSTGARVGGSARFGSSRFGSARIASHNLEIEVGASGSATSSVDPPPPPASAAVYSASTSGGNRPRMSILSGEAVGRFTRRFWSRNQVSS